VIAALSVWIAPAVTRQWDDRQKARELQAGIIASMQSATAAALDGGEPIWSAPPKHVNQDATLDNWELSSLGIEARLRTYMPQRIVAAWQLYRFLIDRFAGGRRI
jgi:hypothetical protein